MDTRVSKTLYHNALLTFPVGQTARAGAPVSRFWMIVFRRACRLCPECLKSRTLEQISRAVAKFEAGETDNPAATQGIANPVID